MRTTCHKATPANGLDSSPDDSCIPYDRGSSTRILALIVASWKDFRTPAWFADAGRNAQTRTSNPMNTACIMANKNKNWTRLDR